MKTIPNHKWTFPSRLRPSAFAWSSSSLACQRIKEAVSEIKAVFRADPLLAAEGAILMMARLWPALQHVDSSSGALGNATHRAVETLIDILIAAPADVAMRITWLERLWEILEDDGVGYVDGLSERWGELCGSPELAGSWADRLTDVVRANWEERKRNGTFIYFKGTDAAFSCLLLAGRCQELLDLLELAPYVYWEFRKYGVRALDAMGRTDDAIAYALASRGLNDSQAAIDRMCETILLARGRAEEAYEPYALTTELATTNIATFRALKKKYPNKEPQTILKDLIARSPGEEGKWFATAKDLKLYDLALELANRSPTEPKTLNRSARDLRAINPTFALGAAVTALRWIIDGYGYDIASSDIIESYRYAMQIAEALGGREPVETQINEMLRADTQWAAFARRALGIKFSS